ncbi:MAG: S-layer homology domain-containing protein [Heliobacteriaceae bacterium]|nr:S-layer homology domain-containing protein [Heliobacteriaceae bacterium]
MKKLFVLLMFIFAAAPAFSFQFPDVAKDHWAAKQIEILSEKGVVVGYPDGTFKPDDNVTRAEFASMAIKALGQENTRVAQPVSFSDIQRGYWAYDAIQKALYFELISAPKRGEAFRPDDSVSRAESISVAVNALTTEQISPLKAKEVLAAKYADTDNIPTWFLIPAGKAEILNMLVVIPAANSAKIEAARPATRAEVSAILYNMMEQAKLNPNAKLAEAMRKKTGDGYIIEGATVQGSVGTIPAGAVFPVALGLYISSQSSNPGEAYTATAPRNYITKDKFILINKGANLKGQLIDVRAGKWFIRNGVLVLDNTLITTNNDQTVPFNAAGEVTKYRNWFMKFVRVVLKGEKLNVEPQGIVYIKLLKPVKIDLSNGWILE